MAVGLRFRTYEADRKCRCGCSGGDLPQVPTFPLKCPDCGTWFQNEHRCQHVLSADCWCEPRVEQVPPA